MGRYLVAPLPFSPILNTLNFSSSYAVQWVSDILHVPHGQGPLPAHLRTLAPPPGLLGPCLLSPLLLLLASPPGPPLGERVGGSRSIWPAVHCSPPRTGPWPAAASPSDSASLRLWLQFQGRTPAGMRPGGASAARPARPCARPLRGSPSSLDRQWCPWASSVPSCSLCMLGPLYVQLVVVMVACEVQRWCFRALGNTTLETPPFY